MHKLLVALGAALLVACSMGDTRTPVPQPDTLIFGRIAAIAESRDEPGNWTVEIAAGLPDAMAAVMRREKRPVPSLEKDLAVRVKVTPDTICVADLEASDIDGFRVGQDVAVVPRPGSCAMVGTKLLLAEAAELYRFVDYETRYLPRTLAPIPAALGLPDDAARINSAGIERTPLALHGGRVVYFAAGLLSPVTTNGQPRGAVRAGMRGSGGAFSPWAVGGFRPYRVAWNGKGWETPQPVVLQGLPAGASARFTWVNDEETRGLVEIDRNEGPHELVAVHRADPRQPWSAPAPVPLAAGTSVGDAQRLGSSLKALVWTVYDANGSDLWLSLDGKPGQALEPRINTLGAEWAPRVGPHNVLFFCRGERQLAFSGGAVQEVRLPGKQLHPLLEAAPSADGSLLFCCIPRYVPGGPDWDLAVTPRAGQGWGQPVRLDDWTPLQGTSS
jgi:hypothetical protein